MRQEDEEEKRCPNSRICVTGTALNRCPLSATSQRPVDGPQPPLLLHDPQSYRLTLIGGIRSGGKSG